MLFVLINLLLGTSIEIYGKNSICSCLSKLILAVCDRMSLGMIRTSTTQKPKSCSNESVLYSNGNIM